MSAVVYTLWRSDGRPAYVGCTTNLARRLREHRGTVRMRDVTRIEWRHYPTLTEALNAEAKRIYELRPVYNVHYNPAAWTGSECASEPVSVRDRKAAALAAVHQGRAA